MCEGIAQVFDFWVGNRGQVKSHQRHWFGFNPSFDQEIRDRFPVWFAMPAQRSNSMR